MPKVLEVNGYKFFFFSNEGNPLEPCHIHVRKGNGLAKFWILPTIRLDGSTCFSPSELKEIEKIIYSNQVLITEAWNEFFCK